jgi:hypothetical protein
VGAAHINAESIARGTHATRFSSAQLARESGDKAEADADSLHAPRLLDHDCVNRSA